MDFRETNKQVVAQFREGGGHGKVGPIDFEHLVLVTTRGRRTGRPHTTPLGIVRDDAGHYVLFGSNLGAPRDPDWVENIRVDPRVHVEITGSEWDAVAHVTSGAEREAAYACAMRAMPHVSHHQEQAGREIPMVLVPAAG